jgi:hypothetical protein
VVPTGKCHLPARCRLAYLAQAFTDQFLEVANRRVASPAGRPPGIDAALRRAASEDE